VVKAKWEDNLGGQCQMVKMVRVVKVVKVVKS
jgi:hypothetical protein